MVPKFKVGDIVYIPDSDYIFTSKPKHILGNVAEILLVENTKGMRPWYSFKFLYCKDILNYPSFHNGYDWENKAEKIWIKLDNMNLKTIEVLYGN